MSEKLPKWTLLMQGDHRRKALPPQAWSILGSLRDAPDLTTINPATKLLFIKNSFVIVFLVLPTLWRKKIKAL